MPGTLANKLSPSQVTPYLFLLSFILEWVPEISDACPGVPYLLIGCKNDLRTDSALQYYLTVPGHDSEENDSISRVKVKYVSYVDPRLKKSKTTSRIDNHDTHHDVFLLLCVLG